MIETHQLLDKDLNINPGLQAFLNKDNWNNCIDYVTMSVIGTQGTGRSTLINAIFGTEFATKKRNSVGRTTLGANISIIQESENTFVVIDSEGIGCQDRLKDCEGDKDKQQVFDTQLTAFILSAVDVLLINIKADQIEQAEVSKSAFVRGIMEINKKFLLSANKRKKTVLYVIRDFNEYEYDQDTLKNKIMNSIEKIEEK